MVRKLAAGLVGLVAVLVALAIGLDVAARLWAQSRLAARAKQASGASGASAEIGNFPVLYRALATGEVPHVVVKLTGVPAGPVRLSALEVSLQGVAVSRHALVDQRRLVLAGVRAGIVSATLSAASLSRIVGRPVRLLADGRASVTVGGQAETVTPVLTPAGDLVLRFASGLVAAVHLPHLALLPCLGAVQVGAGTLRLSCTLHQVPASLAQAAVGSAPAG